MIDKVQAANMKNKISIVNKSQNNNDLSTLQLPKASVADQNMFLSVTPKSKPAGNLNFIR